MAGSESGPVVTVKVLIEQDQIAPARVFLKLRGAATKQFRRDT
jgi:hypothetical protein